MPIIAVRCFSATAALLLSAPASADKITLKSGRVIEGVIQADTRTQVTIRTPAGLLSFPRGAVARLKRESNSKNHASEVAALLATGDLEPALALLDDEVTSLSALLVDHQAPIIKQAAAHSPTTALKLQQLILSTNDAAGLIFLAAYLAARSQSSDALTTLASIPSQEIEMSSARRKSALQTIEQCGDWLLQNPDSRVAVEAFTLLKRLQAGAPQTGATTLLQFQAAQELARRGQYMDALQLTATISGHGSFGVLRPHLDSILQRAVKSGNTTATATVAAAILDRFSNWYSDAGLKALHQTAATSYAEAGNYPEATAVADQLATLDADAGAKLQHKIEFLRKQAETPEDDPVARYKLAIWAREMGLLEEANTLLNTLLPDPVLSENVRLQLNLLEIDRGKAALDGLRQQYERGEFDKVQQGLQEFRARYANAELQQKAQELAELSRYRKWSADRRMPSQAEAAYQHAERLYNQGKLEEARTHALRVITDYTGTTSADKAATLRDKIQREN